VETIVGLVEIVEFIVLE